MTTNNKCLQIGVLNSNGGEVTLLRFAAQAVADWEAPVVRMFAEEHIGESNVAFAIIDFTDVAKVDDVGSSFASMALSVFSHIRKENPQVRVAVCVPKDRIEPFRTMRLDRQFFVTDSREDALQHMAEWPEKRIATPSAKPVHANDDEQITCPKCGERFAA